MFKNRVPNIHGVLLISLGVLMGGVVTVLYFHSQELAKIACVEKYSLTSSALDCDSYEDSASRTRALDKIINEATALYIAQGKAARISVWTRNLEAQQWAASNEFERYSPASLMKLPLMMAYYKLAEIEPSILDTPLEYKRSDLLNSNSQSFMPGRPLVEGQSYKVSDLIEHMITESDNNAAAALLAHLDPKIFDNILIELGLKIPNKMTSYDFATAKSYANLFRSLYNASYLTRDFSEKALELLASSTYKGMAESLPPNTVVAHKFGEREVDNTDGTVQTRELHDCGIIYKDETPYSLCIMTEGKDFKELSTVINNISKIVYENI